MIRWTKLVTVVSTILVIPACSLPIKTVKVNKLSDPVEGVRYVLKRPSYKVGLRVNLKKTQFLKNPSIARLGSHKLKPNEVKLVKLQMPTTDSDWSIGDMGQEESVYCIRNTSALAITLRQEMKKTPLVYEVRSRATPPHWFADSESSISMDDEGILTAITAGEKDKSLEFIQAVAGLVVSAAVPAAVSNAEYCVLFGDKVFHDYITNHIRLGSQHESLKDKLRDTLGALDPNRPEKMKFGLDSATLLRAEIERVKEKLKITQYDMRKGTFGLEGESGSLLTPVPANPWVTVKLTAQ